MNKKHFFNINCHKYGIIIHKYKLQRRDKWLSRRSENISEMSNFEIIKEMEDLLKKYNRKTDKAIYKKSIVKLLQSAEVILAADVDFKKAQTDGEFLEKVILKTDVVKDSERKRMLPIFTSFDQIPDDYAEHFSLIRVQSRVCYNLMNERDDIDGLVINPFTKSMPLIKKVDDNPIRKTEVKAEIDDFVLVHNGERYVVNKWPFTIGRVGTDIEINESYISKIHTILVYKDGKYIIADNDSTNGTKVNGILLKPKVPVVLHSGYKILIADEEEFEVYINE